MSDDTMLTISDQHSLRTLRALSEALQLDGLAPVRKHTDWRSELLMLGATSGDVNLDSSKSCDDAFRCLKSGSVAPDDRNNDVDTR